MAVSRISEMLTKYVGQRREKYGRAGVLAVVGGALLILLNSWQSLDFIVGKREGFAVVAGAVLDFVLSPGFGVGLVAAGAAGVVGLHFYDKSRREQGATSLPTNAPRAEKSPPRVTATQTIRTELDEDGTEHKHVSVTPGVIEATLGVPAHQKTPVKKKPFRWNNDYAGENSHPLETELLLRLEVILRHTTTNQSKWRRGLYCEVTTPSGKVMRSPIAFKTDEHNRVVFHFPLDFDESLELEDDTYKICWLDAVDETSKPAVCRDLPIRQVLLTAHRGKQKPNDRIVLKEDEANRLIRDGVAQPLFKRDGE